ncbi:hypothetical protein O7614_03780 [Micromonospora sp. WMMD961]|uniref:hypothetical protein n=1 Tax=Micromonospora sp. WMMD961 TaxID=3016100 RepID=UPI002415C654|nr:hypothetical protein [Micromonospora sp. WMMD961]MDG4778764.1 hypothetical protein [Micromonospora sp. WMMD961]
MARLSAGGWDKVPGLTSLRPAQVNGYPAFIVHLDGELGTVVAVRIDDGLVAGIYAVRNPAKLSHMERETVLSR